MDAKADLGFRCLHIPEDMFSHGGAHVIFYADVFRECGGARCSHNMVPYVECRQYALSIVQQLVLSPGGDDDMGTLLGLMHTAEVVNLDLKTAILKVLNCHCFPVPLFI